MYDICERLRSTPRADIREVMCEAADEIERLRLTDEERKAIEIAAGVIEDEYLGTSCTDKLGAAVLLYGLLDRIGATAGMK